MGLPPNALYEDLYAFALAKAQVERYCNYCLTSMVQLKKCSACKKLYYCSLECQRTDWKLHKFECKAIKAHNEVPLDSVRLVMRIIGLINKQDYGEVKESFIPGGSRSFLTLLDHPDQQDPDSQKFLTQFMHFAQPPLPNPELVEKIYRKISINSFSVSNSTGNPIGIGMCIKLSAANHSCKPITRVCYRNRIAMLVPVGSRIPTSLEDACHSYIDELMPVAMRRAALKQKYNFDCECEGCLDEERNSRMEAFACGNCGSGWIRNREISNCGACGWQMTRDHYELCRTAEEAAIASRPKLENNSIPLATRKILCEKLLDLFQNTLHDLNVHRMPVLRCLFVCSLAETNLSLALDAGVSLLKIMMGYQSPTDPAVLYHKYQLATLFLATELNADCIRLLEEIREPFETIFTKDSVVVRNIYSTIIKARSST
uniref:MYND-type domain-containing protein n=1 Tax=Caenorhabditis tropicalis TaxID=1561998 RepID=A0A1I7THV3_9PELO